MSSHRSFYSTHSILCDKLYVLLMRISTRSVKRMSHLNEKTIETKTIYEGKIIEVHVESVQLPNGKEGMREVVKHPGAVAVIPKMDDGKYLFVRQFRKPLDRTIVEIPAGKLEKGEDPKETAKRELYEETGYTCQQLNHIISFYTSPGFANEIIHLYEASNLTEGVQQTDEDEFVDVLKLTLDEAQELVEQQQIIDAKTAYAVLYLQAKK